MLALSKGMIAALRFGRNLIAARILLPEDFGIGATFAMLTAFMEMTSNLGQSRQIVQNQRGDSPEWQEMTHAVSAYRGVILAAGTFLLAPIFARIFGLPEATWAFRSLSLLPLLNGLFHSDCYRFQRKMRFGRQVSVDLIPAFVLTILVYPICIWRKDYSALLVLSLLHELIRVAMSHVVSERPYRIRWHRDYFSVFCKFGWPLLLNGILLFGVLQGDRFVIGVHYGMESLGVYSVALLLAMSPIMMLASVHGQLVLPKLSRAQDDPKQYHRIYRLSEKGTAVIAICFAVSLTICGPWLIAALYGPKYASGGTLLMVLAPMLAIRLMRASQSIATLAVGDTKHQLICNMVRSTELILAIVVVVADWGIVWIALGSLIGELAAYLLGVCRMDSKSLATAKPSLKLIGIFATTIAISWIPFFSGIQLDAYSIPVSVMTLAVLFLILGKINSDFRNFSRDLSTILGLREAPLLGNN
ncbi:oligosaccharide flippase family protein [Roseimaritima multifibrata]|nr:oligosaccharide flippase family protein [Roseimaritima multifibrata]